MRSDYANLGIEEHMLTNRQSQPVLWGLQCKSEQPGVMGQHDLLLQLEGQLLLGVEGILGVPPTSHSQLALIIHLLCSKDAASRSWLKTCRQQSAGDADKEFHTGNLKYTSGFSLYSIQALLYNSIYINIYTVRLDHLGACKGQAVLADLLVNWGSFRCYIILCFCGIAHLANHEIGQHGLGLRRVDGVELLSGILPANP